MGPGRMTHLGRIYSFSKSKSLALCWLSIETTSWIAMTKDEIKCIKLCVIHHIPGGKNKFPGSQTMLASLRIYCHPYLDTLMEGQTPSSRQDVAQSPQISLQDSETESLPHSALTTGLCDVLGNLHKNLYPS